MPTYSLDLTGPDGQEWVDGYESQTELKSGDTFERAGWTWRVMEIATSQVQ
jgi:hypothetical protein